MYKDNLLDIFNLERRRDLRFTEGDRSCDQRSGACESKAFICSSDFRYDRYGVIKRADALEDGETF